MMNGRWQGANAANQQQHRSLSAQLYVMRVDKRLTLEHDNDRQSGVDTRLSHKACKHRFVYEYGYYIETITNSM